MPAWVKSLWGFGSQEGGAARPSCVLQAAQFQRGGSLFTPHALSARASPRGRTKSPIGYLHTREQLNARAQANVDARQNRREGQPCRPARYNELPPGLGGTLRRRDAPRRPAGPVVSGRARGADEGRDAGQTLPGLGGRRRRGDPAGRHHRPRRVQRRRARRPAPDPRRRRRRARRGVHRGRRDR